MNTTRTMLLGMLFHKGVCIFEELFETRAARAEVLIEVMSSNYDQVSEAELAEIRDDPDHAENPDEMVKAVHQEYFRYEEQLDLHLGELEVPGASVTTLHLTVTDHGDEIMAEIHPDEQTRRRALIERLNTMTESGQTPKAETTDPQLARELALALGPDARINLLSCTLDTDGHWRPSLEHPAVTSAPAALPEELWVITTEYDSENRGMEINTLIEEVRSGLMERLIDLGIDVPVDAGVEELRTSLEKVFSPTAGTVRIDHLQLVRGAWTLAEDAIS